MTQLTLPLSFSQIQTFFNDYGTNNNLRSYFRGGSHVPDVFQNGNIPTSGNIAISNFLNAYPWPVNGNGIIANIPSTTGILLTKGSSSDHLAGWYLNRHPGDPFYADQGPYNTSNGATNGQICNNNAPFNGDVDPSCALGLVIRLQQFLSTYCIGGATWPTAYLEHQTQSGGWTYFGYNVTYVAGARPSGYSSIGPQFNGNQLAAAMLPYIIGAAIITNNAQQKIINKLAAYSWSETNITSNFTDFATWLVSINTLDSHNINVGFYDGSYASSVGRGTTLVSVPHTLYYYGYDTLSPTFGTIDSTTSRLFAGGTVQSVFATILDSNNYHVYFSVTNPNSTAETWSIMNVNGTQYRRENASLNVVGNQYNYSWSATSNPFGTSGTISVVWT